MKLLNLVNVLLHFRHFKDLFGNRSYSASTEIYALYEEVLSTSTKKWSPGYDGGRSNEHPCYATQKLLVQVSINKVFMECMLTGVSARTDTIDLHQQRSTYMEPVLLNPYLQINLLFDAI